MAVVEKTMLTPPTIAAMFGVDVVKVLKWIHSGELLAFNAATKVGDRPRFLVDKEDLEIFKRSRMVVPVAKPQRRAQKPAVKSYV